MSRTGFAKYVPACVLAVAIFGPFGRADAAWTLKTVYAFGGGDDASDSLAPLVETGGKFYGTSYQGGGSGCGDSGCGAIFSVTKKGKETVPFSFGSGGSGGNSPRAPLLNVGGTFYGTTEYGGTGNGVVFTVTPSGTQNVVHTFQGGSSDGSLPFGGLINVKGTLYGTTAGGGTAGTVFSLTTAGKEKMLYTFKGGTSDGSGPEAGLIFVKGAFYGTTFGGGAHGYGTVFRVTKAGKEKVLYSFAGGQDGRNPFAALTDVNGTLYGTTSLGGGTGCFGDGCGIVFKVTTAGDETVVYRFQGGSDGGEPEARLLDVDGTLYGTTRVGGGSTNCGTYGCGTVFEVTKAGSVNLIHTFGGTTDGSFPQAGLIDVGGALYGTTSGGISTNCSGGCGSVFSLSE